MHNDNHAILKRIEALESIVRQSHGLVTGSLRDVQTELRGVRKELAHMRVDLDALDVRQLIKDVPPGDLTESMRVNTGDGAYPRTRTFLHTLTTCTRSQV